MKLAKNEELSVEFAFCGDIWKFYKEFYHMEDTDEYWEIMVTRSTEIQKKYPGEVYKKIILDVLDEFDRRYKDGRWKVG